MITVSNDALSFTFPEVERGLDERLQRFVEASKARVVAEDRQAAFASLMSTYPYNSQTPEYLRAARHALDALTDDAIATAYEATVWKAAGGRSAQSDPPPVRLSFQRTLRLPDDGKDHPLPPGLGNFPLRRIDELGANTPATWTARGGVALPMYQGEALWMSFFARAGAAMKIGAGGINAVTGGTWCGGLSNAPQDYLPLPAQPWLDGFCVEKGVVRQFVAMPLGEGYSAEEQITGDAKLGGVQVCVVPLNADARFTDLERSLPRGLGAVLPQLLPAPTLPPAPERLAMPMCCCASPAPGALGAMGLGAGGRMKQEIYTDHRPLSDYDVDLAEACFVHVLNSQSWRSCTGEPPPHPPMTAEQYRSYDLPWFDYYRDDAVAVGGSGILSKLKSVFSVAKTRQSSVFAGDASLPDLPVVHLGPADRPGSVRGWRGV